jgi:uncharacterized protein (TIGR02145 family)
MKSRYYYGATLLFLILLISSCRSQSSESSENITDPQANTDDASVVVNLLGSEFVDLDDNNPQASANKQLKNTEPVETYYTLTSPSTLLAAEVSVENSVPLKTSAGINPVAVTEGLPLDIGHKFRLIAYRESDNGFVDYKDFTVGTPSTSGLRLPKDVTYKMVVYSYGTNSLPGITGSEMSSFNTATHSYSSNGQNGFLYWEKSFTPVEGNNTILGVILRHKIAKVTTKINSSALSGSNNITAISPGTLIGHNRDAVFNLSNASVQSRSAPVNVTTTFGSQSASTEWTSNAVFINAESTSPTNKIISFTANVTVNGVTKPITVTNGFTIKPGFLTTYKINLKEVKCGAMVNGVFREFMCYNLGATENGKPFEPAKEIHGGKYQWGRFLFITQAQDQSGISFSPQGGWNFSDFTSIVLVDPCTAKDSNYRLPTEDEWQKVINGNPRQPIGDWGVDPFNTGISYANYSSGVKFGDFLMLPAGGTRSSNSSTSTTTIRQRGLNGGYWSSTYDSNLNVNSHLLGIEERAAFTNSTLRNIGMSVRCIKK